MKKTFLSALFLTVFANQIFAATVNKVEFFPAYLNIGCSDLKMDSAGKLGLFLTKVRTTETESTLTISLEQQLKVCNISKDTNGINQLSWSNANPFKGYEVQFFDFNINELNTRKEVIDTNSKSNRLEAGIYFSASSVLLKTNLTESVSGTAQGSIVINKDDLLDQNDFDLLNAGTEVKKVIVLFSNLNVTAKINNEDFQFGDQHFSGRNVAITFIKVKNTFTVKSISL